MKITKKQLDEIINSDDELIGADKYPSNGSNLDTVAQNTTDNNTGKGHQPFKYDMLARFGFSLLPFFESEEKGGDDALIGELTEFLLNKKKANIRKYLKNPNRIKIDYQNFIKKGEKGECEEAAKKIIALIKPHIEKSLNELDDNLRDSINEDLYIDEKILEKKTEDKDISKEKSKDKDVLDKKLKKIADLINKMDKDKVSKIKNLLEDE